MQRELGPGEELQQRTDDGEEDQQVEAALAQCGSLHWGWGWRLWPWLHTPHRSHWGLLKKVMTCVEAEQPGAQQWGKGLAGFGHQGNHAKEECRGCLLPMVQHQVLIHQVSDHEGQQLTGTLSEDTVANRKEPVEREMWSDSKCSRKRGKKLLLKWQ